MRRMVLALIALVLVAGACGEAEDREVAAGDASTTTVLSAPSPGPDEGQWRAMAEPPASVAPGAAAVWTGSEVVVWGGGFVPDGSHQVGGASYNPATDTWTELPEAPQKAPGGGTAVWTGREILYWGGAEVTTNQADATHPLLGSGVAYDPAARSWRTLSDSPLASRAYHQSVWTGKEMIVWGGVTRCCPVDSVIHDATAAAYDPETDAWRKLADAPAPWSGGNGSAVSKAFDGDMFVWRDEKVGRYSVEGDSWRSVWQRTPKDSDAPFDISTAGPVGIGAVIGKTFYLWTGGARPTEGHAVGLPSGDGKSIADAPHFTDFVPRLAPAADAIFGVNYDYDMYEPGEGTSVWRYHLAADSWERLPNPPAEVGAGATPVWTGTELVVLPSTFGDDRKKGTGAIWSKR